MARAAIKDIGYEQSGFHWETCKIVILLHSQSADTSHRAVDSGEKKEEGAGDQGIMFGYACDETPELMPAPIYYSHKILKLLADARRDKTEPKLGPDSKSQVSVVYKNGKPVGASQIVVSHQHVDEDLSSEDVLKIVKPYVKKALPKGWIGKDTVWHVNPTGKFFIGGPDGDTGLTAARSSSTPMAVRPPHGGGAFPARTRPRSTVRRPTRRATSPRMSLRRGLQSAAASSSPTPSASPSRCRSMSTPSAPARWRNRSSRRSSPR